MGGTVKIDKRMLYKKIGIIVVIVSFLSIVETAISKTVSPKITTEVTPYFAPSFAESSLLRQGYEGQIEGHGEAPKGKQPIVPVITENSTPKNIQKNIEKELLQPSIGKLSLEQIHALSEDQNSQITRSLKITPAAQIQSDKFTQSQAHMSVPEIKKLIDTKYNIKPYQKMIDAIIGREIEYKDDYDVFYHGMNNLWYVPQDLYTRLYFHFKKLPVELLKSFVFLRFDGMLPSFVNVQDFLVKQLTTNGLVNDHELTEMLIATNLALFGNVGNDPECTWQYFMKVRNKIEPDRKMYEKILDIFGLSYTHIDELMQLTKLFNTPEQTIVQIFVPKNKVDEIGYLAWVRGNPAHKQTIDMVLQSLQSKKFEKSSVAMDYYTALFKKEQEKSPVFKNLLERVQAGDFKLSYFLKFYRNYPELIQDINRYQARLIFTHDVLLNPLSGVKIFRYSAVKPEQLQKYQQKFDEVFKKIVAGA